MFVCHSVLWDSNHSAVEDVCIAWRKGLKVQIWQLPLRTHTGIVAPICGLLPLRLELMCRCAGFIVKCLKSSNGVVRSIAIHGLYVQRMRSPVGRNAQHCASVFEVPLFDLAGINKKSAWSLLHGDYLVKVTLIVLLNVSVLFSFYFLFFFFLFVCSCTIFMLNKLHHQVYVDCGIS